MNCIIVPVYKEFNLLTNEELISLRQLFKVLGSYKIFLVGPKNLQYDTFLKEAQKRNVFVRVKRFSDEYFYGIEGYNKLMMSLDFYQKFRKFKYALIYQLDAYVFRDELKYWCNKGYDYIGAPWFEGYNLPISTTIIGVGNGGLSLRKVSGAIKISRQLRLLEILEEYKNFNWKGILPRLLGFLIKLIKQRNVPSTFAKNFLKSEDYFWTVGVGERLGNFSCNTFLLKFLFGLLIKNNFKVAPPEIALKFSFEVHPAILYQMNNEKLPFGCHAWKKYDPKFWGKFILTRR